MSKNWEKYEDIATYLLKQIKKELKLTSVEGKQKLVGHDSGTEWEVDAKGIVEGSEGLIIIECRRYTASKQNQEKMAALAYRIQDTKAEGGIIVSPLGLQEGAQKVAAANNIKSIEIDAYSTPRNFTLKFLNQLFIGVTAEIGVSAKATLTVSRKCKSCGNVFEPISTETLCTDCNNA